MVDINTNPESAKATSSNPADAVSPVYDAPAWTREVKKIMDDIKQERERDVGNSVKQALGDIEAEKAERARRAQEEELRVQTVRMQYYFDKFGYKGAPDPRVFSLIGNMDVQDNKLITVLKDGKSAIIDDGKTLSMNSPEFNDDSAQVLASQLLAKKWDTIKVGGSKVNRFKLAAHLLAQDPNVKLLGIDVDPELKKYAAMLRETRLGEGPQNNSRAAPQNTPPKSPAGGNSGTPPSEKPTLRDIIDVVGKELGFGKEVAPKKDMSIRPETKTDSAPSVKRLENDPIEGEFEVVKDPKGLSAPEKGKGMSAPGKGISVPVKGLAVKPDEDIIDVDYVVVKDQKLLPGTSDFPVGGEQQQLIEGTLSERGAALEDMRQDAKARGIPVNRAQLDELIRINNVLDGIQNATPQERGAYKRIMDVTVKALDSAPKENIPTILAQASDLVDAVREAKQKETDKGKKSALGVFGQTDLSLEKIRGLGTNGPNANPKM